jgi:AcrR family transcriptional regulator
MRNPEATKEAILRKSGVLFNTQGYKATSISEITEATGYTKGAIYRHFNNKDELERHTMAHLSGLLFQNMRERIKAEKTAGDKLRAIFKYFESYITNPPLKGGCPLLNAAIEADDAHAGLRKEALRTMNILRESIVTILKNGIEHKQIKSSIDKEFYATLFIATLEGGIMMSKLEGNNNDIRKMIKHLNAHLTEIEL